MIYETDTDKVLVYNGSAWLLSPPTSSPTFTGVPAAPTATAGTDTTQLATTAFANTAGGLVFISTTSLSSFSTNITNCFTSTYTNYRIVFSYIGSTANAVYIRFLVGSTVQTGNILSSNFGTAHSAPTTIVGSSRGDQYALFTTAYTVYPGITTIDVFSPQDVEYTSFSGFGQLGLSSSDSYGVNLYARNIATTQIDGFQLTTATGASVLTGTVTIYGYRK